MCKARYRILEDGPKNCKGPFARRTAEKQACKTNGKVLSGPKNRPEIAGISAAIQLKYQDKNPYLLTQFTCHLAQK